MEPPLQVLSQFAGARHAAQKQAQAQMQMQMQMQSEG